MTVATLDQRTTEEVADLVERLRPTRLPPPAERRAIRLAARATIHDVAKAVGVDNMTISRWERGVSRPWPRHVSAYVRVLEALSLVAAEIEAEKTQK